MCSTTPVIRQWLPTKRPSREFAYRRVRRFLKGKRFDTALDLACGIMRMARYIDARQYIGLDIDANVMERGRRGAPQRKAVVSTIEDMPPDLMGDLVLCLQTIGINVHARVDLTTTHVERMIAATRTDGALIVNVGPLSKVYFGVVESRLRHAFRTVEVTDYGRFRSKQLFPMSHFAIWLMEARPESAVDDANPMKLFIAEGRRAVDASVSG